MSLRKIVRYPAPVLREKCQEVKSVTKEVQTLLSDMAETMYHAPGIGLAAPQIGVNARVIVLDVGNYEGGEKSSQKGKLYKLVNPEIVKSEGSALGEEGCLSIPGVSEKVKRATHVTVAALNEKGEKIEIEAEGILAVCLQHEIDHLNGVLFIDYLSKLKKKMISSKLKNLEKNYV